MLKNSARKRKKWHYLQLLLISCRPKIKNPWSTGEILHSAMLSLLDLVLAMCSVLFHFNFRSLRWVLRAVGLCTSQCGSSQLLPCPPNVPGLPCPQPHFYYLACPYRYLNYLNLTPRCRISKFLSKALWTRWWQCSALEGCLKLGVVGGGRRPFPGGPSHYGRVCPWKDELSNSI